MEIATERLLLRPMRAEDSAQVQALASDHRIAATTLALEHPYPEGAAARWIGTHALLREKGHLVWGIVLRTDGTLIGTIGLRGNRVHRRAELGYWIGVPWWGNGYATEAVRAVIAHGFLREGWERIYAQHLEGNLASGRVMAKAGLRFEGVLRGCVIKDGRRWDTPLYAMLKDDWMADQANPKRTPR